MTDSQGSPPLLDNTNELIQQFISLLSTYKDPHTPPSPELLDLLQLLSSQHLLINVLKVLIAQESCLTEHQKNWFCTHCLLQTPEDVTLLPYIIKLTSFLWLERRMKANAPLNFDLLKIAINSPEYLKQIHASEDSQNRFLEALAASKLTHRQLLEIIQLTQDKQAKSLLIIHLLSQEDYVSSLKGQSIIDTIKNNADYTPSRLNNLIHQIEINTLTAQRIAILEPEAATSILFSIPHFHQLSEQQISSLLGRNPQPNIIAYWISNYYFMPNAHHLLAQLLKLASPLVILTTNNLDPAIRERLVCKMLYHIELYNPIHLSKLKVNDDTVLIYAIQLYLQGHQSKSIADFISQLTLNLLTSKQALSNRSVQLLLCLSQFDHFKKINHEMSSYINYCLRAYAERGDIRLFYEDTLLNTLSINQKINVEQLLVKDKPQETREGFLDFLFSDKDAEKETHTGVVQQEIREHPIVAELMKRKKNISALDYYILHFKGEPKQLSKLITDYLNYCLQEGATEIRRSSLHHMAILITRSELSTPIRDTIYKAFLRFPEIFDEQIAYSLLVHNVKETIQHYGMKGGVENYNHLLILCEYALKQLKLNHNRNKDIIETIAQVQKEAKLEIMFAEETGFFERLIRRFKRCWYYGWSGFFTPKSPVYVVTSDDINATDKQKIASEPALPIAVTTETYCDISSILQDIKSDCTVEKLNEFIKAYRSFSLKAKSKKEELVRQELHFLYKSLLVKSEIQSDISDWLNNHQELFEQNALRLIELKLELGKTAEISPITQDFTDTSMFLNRFKQEITCTLPQQIPAIKNPSVKKPEPETLLNQTANLLSDSVTSALGRLSSFYTNASSYIKGSSILEEFPSCSVKSK